MAQTSPRTYLSLREAAEYLGYESERTVRRLISSGQLPAYRIAGKTIRIRRLDLDNLVEPIGSGNVA